MHVGQEEDGRRNIIFLQLDTPLEDEMVEELGRLKTVKRVTPLEF
jgi:D-3-phosphoglycerate dehydrogenase